MLIAVVVLLIVSIAGLSAALVIGTPAPGYPRYGTFGVNGLDSSFIAWACAGLCVVGLVLLYIDSKWERSKPAEPGDHDHTAGDELFGESDVERDLEREDHG
ncbi:MAG: hypothetical protein QOE41_1129 [Mycobacterium sp.]|jgi:hypothetical protein|nr:hypothetical protein [Mycobacterium sp.]MDT5131818.1 hypothetical protein [Mycobacterium sp.]